MAARGVQPADQGFKAFHAPVIDAHERLELEEELVVLHAHAQVGLEFEPLHGVAVHRAIESAHTGLAGRLRDVHRGVGIPQHGFLVVVGVGNGDADADADDHFPPTDAHGHVQQREQALGEHIGIIAHFDRLDDDAEFVAAKPRDGFTGPHGAGNATSHDLQQFVAGGMAKRVVHTLESVKVEQEHGHATVAKVASGEGVMQAVPEEHAIGQTGEVVLERLLEQLALHVLPLRDVLNHADHARFASEGDAGDGELSPHDVPLLVEEAALDGGGVALAGTELAVELAAGVHVFVGRE